MGHPVADDDAHVIGWHWDNLLAVWCMWA